MHANVCLWLTDKILIVHMYRYCHSYFHTVAILGTIPKESKILHYLPRTLSLKNPVGLEKKERTYSTMCRL